MTERLEIDTLRALLAIAKCGGVTRAAESLRLSQSAVSHKIKRLEQVLDCTLLARRPGAPLFTQDGERLKNYAHRIVELHDEALADLGKKPLAGTLRLGMTEDTATSDIARILGRFTRLYPNVSVRTRASQSLNVQAWFNAGELDVAIMQVFTKDVLKTDLVLFKDSLHWVKSPDFTLDLSKPVPFLSFDANCFYRQWGLDEGHTNKHRLEKVLECPSAAGIQSAVRSGLGIALLNGMHRTQDIEVIERIFPSPPEITFVARTHAKHKTAPVRALVQEIARGFRQSIPVRAEE